MADLENVSAAIERLEATEAALNKQLAEIRHKLDALRLERAVEKIDAILERHFSSLPPGEQEAKQRAFIESTIKDLEDRRDTQEENSSASGRENKPIHD